MITILIADDHHLFREGIKALLRSTGKVRIVDEASNAEELVEKYFLVKPTLVLSDISMPGNSGIKAAEKILFVDANAKILFLTMHNEDEYIYYANKAGGCGLVTKDSLKDELLNAIYSVSDGNKYFSGKPEEEVETILKKYESEPVNDVEIPIENLTRKELKIIEFVAEGYTSNEISKKLDISKRTVDKHRENIMAKFNLRSLPEFLKFAIRVSHQLK